MNAISGEPGMGEPVAATSRAASARGEPELDFFVSRRGATAAIAQEVADVLIASGHTVLVQDYDILAGANFVAVMHDALKRCRDFIALLTRDYDTSPFTRAEWTNFYASASQSGGERRLILFRVEDCNPEGLLAAHVFIDLVGIDDPTERKRIILDAAEGRQSPSVARLRIFEHVPARDTNFTGRDRALVQLHNLLQTPSSSTVQVAIHNLGGTGKTALASEYAHRRGSAYGGVWWAPAAGRTLLIASLAGLAGRLDPKLADEPDQEKAARAGLQRLARSAVPYLLIYDNVDQPGTLRDLVPASGARVLITTRWVDWFGRAIEMKLDLFDDAAAVHFLQKRAGRNDEDGATKLAAALGYLPLALDHAGAYCRLTGASFDGYREKIDIRIVRAPTGAAYPASVAATFGLAIEQVVATHPQAETLLGCFAFLAPERIPLDLAASAVTDEEERAEALMALAGASLVEHHFTDSEPTVTVHRLVQAAMRARLAERQTAAAHAVRVTQSLAGAFPSSAYSNPKLWRQCAALLPHVLALFEAYRLGKYELPEAGAILFDAAAGYLHARGAYGEAELLFRAAVAAKERLYGRSDPRFATALGNLALLLQETGRTKEAEAHFREVIETEEKALGSEHEDLALSLNNLANLLHGTGRSAQAEPLLREAIRIKEHTLGREHPSVATSLNNLANVLRGLGRTSEAEPIYRQAIAIEERTLGRDHPNVATSLHNLGVVLRDAGRYSEAEPLLRDAVAVWSTALGQDHALPGRGRRNLAMLLLATGRAEEAVACAQAALGVHEKALGADHPWSRDSALTCAEALAAVGQTAEADELGRRYRPGEPKTTPA